MNDVWLDSLVVYCADIGSVKRGKFGWASRCIGPDPRQSGGTTSAVGDAGRLRPQQR